MKIYFAGTPGTKERERKWQTIFQHRLVSFWDISQKAFNVHFAFKLIVRKKKK